MNKTFAYTTFVAHILILTFPLSSQASSLCAEIIEGRQAIVRSELEAKLEESARTRLAFLPPNARNNAINLILDVVKKFDVETRKKSLPERYKPQTDPTQPGPFTEKSMTLITYGDSIKPDVPNGRLKPLDALANFKRKWLSFINGTHVLPFHPYSSDRGFAPINSMVVDPNLGNWQSIRNLRKLGPLMLDHVVGHVSSKFQKFQDFLKGDLSNLDYFINIRNPNDPRLQQLVRPRTTPVLTPFRVPVKTDKGTREVTFNIWTTFSADQIDLNYRNPQVIADTIKTYVNYIANGADIVRMDAVTYLFKRLGTSGAHLPETHQIVQLFQDVAQYLYAKHPELFPDGKPSIITETNVPHKENISYFGRRGGVHEADMVYNFTLPPMVAHALLRGQSQHITAWIRSLEKESLPDHAVFFNMLATHDGVGVNGLRGTLLLDKVKTEQEIQFLADKARELGGQIGMKNVGDKSIPYELQISYIDLLRNDHQSLQTNLNRLNIAYGIQMALKGVPGIWINTLLGARNDYATYEQTKHGRDLNRANFSYAEAEARVSDSTSWTSLNYNQLKHLIEVRKNEKAFSPYEKQEVLDVGEGVLALTRGSGAQKVVTLFNLTNSTQSVQIPQSQLGKSSMTNLLDTSMSIDTSAGLNIQLKPYQMLWLK